MIIIDVREKYEYDIGHVKGSLNIPSSDIVSDPDVLEAIPKDEEIILYCASGNRASSIMSYMKQLGYEKLTNGINQAYVEANYF